MNEPVVDLRRRSQTTLVDDIVDDIRDRILRGELEPGLKIRQQHFAEVLGVSRTPLREAFQRLEAHGWVELRARRGAEVRPLTVAEAEEIFTMRVVLETAAARLSASAHGELDVERARALLAADAAAPDPSSGGIDDGNQAFHEIVYALGAPMMPRELGSTLRSYWTRALRYRLVYWSRPQSVARSQSAHEAIFAAWSARDPEATERAVADHILTALWEVTARLDPAHRPSPAPRALAERYRVDLLTTQSPEDR